MKRHEYRTRTPRVRSLLVVAALMWGGATVATAADWRSKVDPSVLATAETGEQTEFLVFLKDQADLSGTPEASTKEDKGRYVFEHLRAAATRSQGSLIETLKASGYSHRSFRSRT